VTQAATAVPAPIPVRIPIRQIVPWALLVGLLALIALYFVSTEQGAAALIANSYIHEFLHDGRHLLAFPCH
jgi:hypothetical protein